jgi:quercetin dioxygenase-like cupin family protein
MKRVHWKPVLAVSIAAALSAAGIHAMKAQQAAPTVKRNVVMKQDSVAPGREVVMAQVELPPGGREGKHTHFAEVYAFVLEGTVNVDIEGETKTYHAGEVFFVPQGKIHEASNTSGAPVKIAAVFVAEKGKPLTTQVQ